MLKQLVRQTDTILNIAGPNKKLSVTVFTMSALMNAHPISVSDKNVRVGLNCIDTPKL